MEVEKMTPETSFALITQMINEAKSKFEENGFIYMMWGTLVALASLGQFALLKYEYYNINYFPYFLMPLGSAYTWYYYAKKKKGRRNQIGHIVSYAWVVITLNLLILGFFFGPFLKEALIPVLLILLSVGTVISGAAIKSGLLLISGVIINLSGFAGFALPWIYQPLLMGIVAIVVILVPGIVLMRRYKQQSHV